MNTKRISKLFLASIALVMMLSFFANATPPADKTWTLVLSDEFEDTSIDSSIWGYETTPWGSETLGDCSLTTGEDVYLENGNLVLRARKGPFQGPSGTWYDYSAGWAWTRLWKTGGYLEIRAQYPYYRGAWPAFWMLAQGWPPEIDIAEYRGPSRDYMTFAYCYTDGGDVWVSNHITDDFTVWHTYGLEWGPGYLKWYVDDEVVHSFEGEMAPDWDMYVILSAGTDCGDDDGTGFPNYYLVDYFRWYQTNTHPGAPAAPTGLVAVPDADGVYLCWNRPVDWDVSHYNVYSSTTLGGPYTLVASDILVTGHTDTSVTSGTTYYYVVTAVDNDTNESVYSNEALATAIDLTAITVENFSLELPGTVKQSNWDSVPGWSSDSRVSDSGVEASSAATDGSWIGYLKSSDPGVCQTMGHTIAAGQVFVLDLDGVSTYNGQNLKLSFYYLDGSDKIEMASTTANVTTSMNRYSLVCSADDVPASIGKTIGIEINNTDSIDSWVGFDNVRMSYGGEAVIGTDMYVDDIAMGYRARGRSYYGQATVTIKDDSGSPLGGAAVNGIWSGAVNESASGVTATDGTVFFETADKAKGTFTFTVTNVVKSGYVYNDALNVETSDSITP